MMSAEDEKIFIGKVLEMKEKGFSASKAETLPALYRERYGRLYNNCGACIKDAFDTLVKWADRKNGLSSNKNNNMGYKFKKEYWNKTIPILHQGKRLIINSSNLTDKTAQILLALPKYAHILEGSVDEPEANTDEQIIVVKKTVKGKGAGKKNEEVVNPNEGTQSVESSASTSTEQPTDGKKLNRRGKGAGKK